MILAFFFAVHFIPEAALNAAPTPATAEALRQIAAIQWDPRNGCIPPIERDLDSESAGTTRRPDLSHFLQRSKTIAAGRVETITSGWNIDTHRPSTLVAMRITEPLRDASQGDVVTFEIEGGRITAAGRTLCSEPHTAVPKVGDAMLVAGHRDEERPSHIVAFTDLIFAVREQAVIVPPALNLAGEHRVPLASLRQNLMERKENQ
jgi:hypothetical protein